MDILNTKSLESNRQIKINFDGGDLSSDAGLILIKEFACKLGFIKILQSMFKTNDSASYRLHKDDQNLWQVIYQILGAYFEDDCADELTNDLVLTAILEKKSLASQPTLFRFFNRMDETTLDQFYSLMRRFRKAVLMEALKDITLEEALDLSYQTDEFSILREAISPTDYGRAELLKCAVH